MYDDMNTWAPIVAERERSQKQATTAYPCRGPYNRYLGCIGARKCRATGVEMCVLGRWPDERQVVGRGGRAPAEPPVLQRNEPAQAAPVPVAAAPPVAQDERDAGERRRIVGIVHHERRAWQQLSRHVANAGFEPVWLMSVEAVGDALTGSTPPGALLVAGPLGMGGAGEALLMTAARQDVPVLTLPGSARGGSELEAAARMAVVWLAVTFRDRGQSVAGQATG